MAAGVREMGEAASFRGYGPEQGYDFLREAVQGYYASRDVGLERRKSSSATALKATWATFWTFSTGTTPCWCPIRSNPVYVDTNLMAGRPILYLGANEENGFLPLPDASVRADLIYLCSPTTHRRGIYQGAAATMGGLRPGMRCGDPF